ncbi:MAG TPA: ABC transporter substrate-binding protein [Candidatus Binatia bacterium]|nr:ABC transporter substrate-binding protein [Candidatus Binatia bacterium]
MLIAWAISFGFFAIVDAQELKPFRISLSLGSAQLPLWAARDAGLFAKYGLDAELLGIQSASRQVQLILAGDALAASLSGTTPVRARIEGADTTIMMGLLNSFTLSVIAAPEINKPADLKGRYIGVGALGGSPTLLTQRLLKKWGLESDVKFLATGGYIESLAALEKRRIHAAVLDPPRAYIGRKKFGFSELANLGQEFKYATTVIVVRESLLRKERETFSQFAKGVIEGIHRVKTDREFAIKVLGKMLRSNDREILEETYRVFSALYEKTPYPALEGIQPILDEISTQIPKAKTYKPENFVDTSIVRQLEQSGFVGSVYR